MTISTATAAVLTNIAGKGNKALRDILGGISDLIFGVTAGTVTASKAVIVDSLKAIGTFLSVTATTFIGNLQMTRNAPVAAAGTTVTDATQLSAGFTVVTGADGTKGVKLPATPVAGTIVIIKGTTSAVLKVWPDAAATINAIGSNGALSLASGVIPAIFIADSTTQWYSIPLLPS